MAIRILPKLVVNQIAAGEVVDRPASVVKELVENSLDAGAGRVDVAIEEGGRQLIRVADDGSGMSPDDLPLAAEPHATSKLESSEQLARIATLGFRGEAVASIASVSRMLIASRAVIDGKPAAEGYQLQVDGDQRSDLRPWAGNPGTVVEVRDLFFNTPARRKFLRAPSTEFGQIADMFARLAMAHPQVGFTLSHNGRATANWPRVTSLTQRCIAVLGEELADALLEFEHDQPPRLDAGQSASGAAARPPRVWGLAGLPRIARASAKFQYLFVNGRPIRDRGISHAFREAYRGLLAADRQPVMVVMLELDPGQVDVNVHPTKAEVRFRDPSAMHGLVLGAIRRRLLLTDLTPDARVGLPQDKWENLGGTSISAEDGQVEGWTVDGAGAARGGSASGLEGSGSPGHAGRGEGSFVDRFRRMSPSQQRFVYEDVRKALAESGHKPEMDDSPLLDHAEGEQSDETAAKPAVESAAPVARPVPILQVHKSYIVTQDEQGIVIVDQHALHERVMFEELSRRVLGEGRPLESQRLLMPELIKIGARRVGLVEELSPLLQRLGIDAAPMGPDTIGIHAFPTFLFDRHVSAEEFVLGLLDQIEEGRLEVGGQTAQEAALHRVLDMMACKAAVKAGDRLSEEELAALLAKRQEVERASNCPHGRPTQIRLSLKELEKQFGRT
ncbi:MAG: DNA mismatch repair endonuclease MutL [Phycisphaeraceae bacterium]|nr:DNA mismatch repair endonuclease MutL [Phycisphaeraceae bacterium]